VPTLQGNAAKAKQIVGWRPTVAFNELVDMMVDQDMTLNGST